MILIKALAAFFIANSLLAADLTQFEERFEFIRDDEGVLRTVRDNSIITRLSIAPYVEMLKTRLLNEQELMNRKSSDYDASIKAMFSGDEVFETKSIFTEDILDDKAQGSRGRRERREALRANNEENLVKSMRSLQQINVDKVFNNPGFKNFLNDFEGRLTEALEILDLRVIANVTDSTFFYKRAVAHRVVDWALNQAKKRFSSVPLLNTASYVIVQVAELVSENREFRQNMLLHYLENVNEEELGLSASEVNRIMSSVYESRIEWSGFFESRRARQNWEKYGINTFYASIRLANNRWRGRAGMGELGPRLNFAFQESQTENGRVIYNLFHTDHQFSQMPALAYNYDKPNFVKRKRMIVKLAELGVSFLTLPNWIKSSADTFLKSIYKEQELSEGSLYAYFAMEGDQEGMNLVKRQFFNPFANL